ncbi:S46 family peptidase [Ideonella sp. 4Y11]|uniref:Dipeptidyl-peptidase n=1 Tax=Ideonella aquatica TaxID=2824119 RepID=A0A941BLS6_9BURK|nr:S46 family peptidase [Ideonella aquatica]MBQ0961722.1 S46 family peptidase [Ideonella aquatica]
MWPLDQVPHQAWQRTLGVSPSAALLARLQAASVRLGLDGSGSFVSPQGLVLTNYHVVQSCIEALSTPRRNLAVHGFTAARRTQERRCPDLALRQQIDSRDVSAEVDRAIAAMPATDQAERVRQAEVTRLEAACQQAHPDQVCEVGALHAGARHVLRRYREWDDVRLVWVPEAGAALFGGAADNVAYPRFALDAALLRVHDRRARPLRTPQALRRAAHGARDGDALFVAGFPAESDRLRSVAQAEFAREVTLPQTLAALRAQLDALPQADGSAALRYELDNSYQILAGEWQALQRPALLAQIQHTEQRLRALQTRSGDRADPWAEIARAVALQRALAPQIEALSLDGAALFARASTLVALVAEGALSDAQRLPEYRQARRAELQRSLLAASDGDAAQIQRELAQALHRSRELLGAAHPFVQAALDGREPAAAAAALLADSRLGDATERQRLLAGGAAALAASTDPLLRLAREHWPQRRALLQQQWQQVEQPLAAATRAIGRLAAAMPDELAPDADFSLRLSAGRARGVDTGGRRLPWTTTWGGWWDRADSFDQAAPFQLPPTLARARAHIDPRTPLNLVLDADLAPGYSGSPVVNVQGELVGLLFDGNGGSLGFAWGFDADQARGVAVHAQALQVALSQVYPGRHLLREMGWPATAASTKIQPAPRARHPREKR